MNKLRGPESRRQHVSCVCGADQPAGLGTKNGFDVVRCANCGMVYVNPQPTPEELREFYSAQYWNQHQISLGLKPIEDRVVDSREKAYFSDLLRWLTSRVPLDAGKRLLEVGCSHGIFCELVAGLGPSVVGVEMDEQIANSARQRTGLEIHSGGLASQAFKEGEFDVMCMFDVFEHFYEPRTELERISHFLKQGGWLYLSTPCRDNPAAQKDVLEWGENKPPEHLFLYGFNDLEKLLMQYGFHVWDAKGIYSSRMFVLARRDEAPKTPYRMPPLWPWRLRESLRTLERTVRHSLRGK